MAEDWRDRYLKLADQHERVGAAHSEAERELVRLVTRLCVACSGLDPQLDPHLKHLRNLAKAGKAEALSGKADEFAKSVAQTVESRSRPGVLSVLLGRSASKSRQSDEIQRLWAEVAADPATASNDRLDRLAELLRASLGPAAKSAEPRSGLFGRLIGKSADTEPPPGEILLELLQSIPWPESIAGKIAGFRADLQADESGEAWSGVIREISELAVDALNQSQDAALSTEAFLNQLSQRLEELDRHMCDETQRRDDSRQSSESLDRDMDVEVVSLTASVRDSENLSELQANVIGSLDRMQTHVRRHLSEESQRRELAEADSEALRGRLNELEQETFDLRRQVAQTYREAMRDQLTGLPNRRAYDERIAQEHARWRRFGEPLALLVLDVDDFKKLNDTFGHKSGDKALAMIGKILNERLRETDFIARYGGEEFVVLLAGARGEDALLVADSMRKSIMESGLHAKGQPVKLTVSGGIALFAEGDTPEGAFERADRALYEAKKQGKNCVVVA